MDIFNVTAGAIGVLGVIFSIVTYMQARREKIATEQSVAVLKKTIKVTQSAIKGALTQADEFVRQTHTDENLKQAATYAKSLRIAIYTAGAASDESWESVSDWRFGKMIESRTTASQARRSKTSD